MLAGVRRLECMTDAQTREGGSAGATTSPGRKSDGASLGAQPGLGFHAVQPCPARRAACPDPATWGRVSASCLPSCGCATGGPWRGCAGRTLGEAESRATMGGRCSAGQGAPGSVSLETPHPGPGAPSASWAACAAPGSRLSPSRGGGCEPSHLVLWSSQARSLLPGAEFLPETESVSSEAFRDPWLRRLCQEAPAGAAGPEACPRSPSARAAGPQGPGWTHPG